METKATYKRVSFKKNEWLSLKEFSDKIEKLASTTKGDIIFDSSYIWRDNKYNGKNILKQSELFFVILHQATKENNIIVILKKEPLKHWGEYVIIDGEQKFKYYITYKIK